jgi:hypothetical protein
MKAEPKKHADPEPRFLLWLQVERLDYRINNAGETELTASEDLEPIRVGGFSSELMAREQAEKIKRLQVDRLSGRIKEMRDELKELRRFKRHHSRKYGRNDRNGGDSEVSEDLQPDPETEKSPA